MAYFRRDGLSNQKDLISLLANLPLSTVHANGFLFTLRYAYFEKGFAI